MASSSGTRRQAGASCGSTRRILTPFYFSTNFATLPERKAPKSSALRDLQHAVCAAAAADIFVTHDEELAFLLRRVPIKDFRVMRLRELSEDTLEQ
jgi:hypothetical protein